MEQQLKIQPCPTMIKPIPTPTLEKEKPIDESMFAIKWNNKKYISLQCIHFKKKFYDYMYHCQLCHCTYLTTEQKCSECHVADDRK
jgi:hypothetical protein